MYVKEYLDLSLKSLVFFWLSASWPCTWEPGRGVPDCRGRLCPFCCWFVFGWCLRDFYRNGPVRRFTFSPCTMGFAACVGMQRSEFSERLIYNFNVDYRGREDLASNFSQHLSKREFSFQSWCGSFRIEPSQVG